MSFSESCLHYMSLPHHNWYESHPKFGSGNNPAMINDITFASSSMCLHEKYFR